MASLGYNYINTFTDCDRVLLRDLVNMSVLQYGDLSLLLEVNLGVLKGDKMGFVGRIDMIGENAPMCDPDWNTTNIAAEEKTWNLGPFMITETICADDYDKTIARYTMRTQTERADLTGTDIVTIVLFPAVEQGTIDGIWRCIFHGDTAFATVTDGGIFSNTLQGQDKFFNMTDGLWKQLFTAVPTGSEHHVPIAANEATSKAAQYADIFQPGVATGIFRNLIYQASPILRQQPDAQIIATQSLADALAADILQSNVGSAGQWDAMFDGSLTTATRFLGVPILANPKLDEMIQRYNDLGATYYRPHRAVYAAKQQLNAGFQGDSLLPDIDIWFDRNSQKTKMLARTELGVLTIQDDIISMAY